MFVVDQFIAELRKRMEDTPLPEKANEEALGKFVDYLQETLAEETFHTKDCLTETLWSKFKDFSSTHGYPDGTTAAIVAHLLVLIEQIFGPDDPGGPGGGKRQQPPGRAA